MEAFFAEKVLADCPAHKPVCKGNVDNNIFINQINVFLGSYHTHSKTCGGECVVEQRSLFSDIGGAIDGGVKVGSQIAGWFGRR